MFGHLLWGDKGIPSDGSFLYCQLESNLITTTWRPVPQPVNGNFLYCQLITSQISDWRPTTQSANGTFLYCSQDINQFDRTP